MSRHSFANTSIRLDDTISIWAEFANPQQATQAQPRVLNAGFRLDVATTPKSPESLRQKSAEEARAGQYL